MPNTSFSLTHPALVCRWRLSDGQLPLLNRHIRALATRTTLVTPELAAWVKGRVLDMLAAGSAAYPDGVLMLVVDASGAAAMSVGPYEQLDAADTALLVARAHEAQTESEKTGVAPEVLASEQQGTVVFYTPEEKPCAAFFSLVLDLLDTLHIPYEFAELSHNQLPHETLALISDEHGVVCSKNTPQLSRLKKHTQKLFTK